jgi:hypothetical protein
MEVRPLEVEGSSIDGDLSIVRKKLMCGACAALAVEDPAMGSVA